MNIFFGCETNVKLPIKADLYSQICQKAPCAIRVSILPQTSHSPAAGAAVVHQNSVCSSEA